MPQHKMKTKVNLPKGVKQKVKKPQKNAGVPKKGAQMTIAPKKAIAVDHAKVASEVTRIINEKNEEMLKNRADKDQGRTKKK